MDNSQVNVDLIRDHVDTIILSTLANGDRYGLDILTEIKENSKGLYELKQPTLYSCLKRLEKLGYVTSYKGDTSNGAQRVYYSLLDDGRKFLEKDQAEWEYARTIINGLLSDKEYDPNATPPFQASELRPRTKRQPRSEPSAAESAEVYNNQIVVSENETPEITEPVQQALNLDSDTNDSTPIIVNDNTQEAAPSQNIKILNPDLKTVIVPKDAVLYEQDVDYVGVLDDIFAPNEGGHIYHGSRHFVNELDQIAAQDNSSFANNEQTEYVSQYSLDAVAQRFAKEGFTIKPYFKKNTTEFYVNKYIYINKILLTTSVYSYLVYAFLLTVLHLSTMTAFATPAASFLLPLFLMAIVPLFFIINYYIDPTKKVSANFSLKKTLSTASIFLVNAILLIILIGFVGFKANFVEPSTLVQPIIFPAIMILCVPISILIYSYLYNSTHYHVN